MTSTLPHTEPRKATWFELFFDLVFVTSVSSLALHFASDFTAGGAISFSFLFLVLWWLWLGHAFHASRFDRDRPDQWALGFVQMVAVIFLSWGSADAFADRAWAFAAGAALFKAVLMLGYLREVRRPGLARLCTLYGAIYGGQALLWAGSIALAGPAQLGLWLAALLLDLASPFLVARETHRAPPHPEHLPERFGLFTLILLGETAAAAVHALDHGPLTPASVTVALSGALLGFLFWLGYFRRARGQTERHVQDARSGRMLRLWAFGHIPLYLGIAGLGAGSVALSHHPVTTGPEGWLYAAAVALAMVGITAVSLGTSGRALRAGWPFFAVAALTALLPALTAQAPTLSLALILAALAQIALSIRLDPPHPA